MSPGGFNFQRDKHLQGECRPDPAGLGWDSTPCISVISQVVALRAPVGVQGGLGAGRETLWLHPGPCGCAHAHNQPSRRSQVKTPGRLRSPASQRLQRPAVRLIVRTQHRYPASLLPPSCVPRPAPQESAHTLALLPSLGRLRSEKGSHSLVSTQTPAPTPHLSETQGSCVP